MAPEKPSSWQVWRNQSLTVLTSIASANGMEAVEDGDFTCTSWKVSPSVDQVMPA